MLNYYGYQLLQELLDYYKPRLQLAEERGYAVQGSKYAWLYEELQHRMRFLRQTVLFLDALPKFMGGEDDSKPMQYVVSYTSRFFTPESIGDIARDAADTHPFFNSGNIYWNELQQALDHFGVDYDMSNLPLLYVDLTEYVVRASRLYLQIREGHFRAIDRDKFDSIMGLNVSLRNAG